MENCERFQLVGINTLAEPLNLAKAPLITVLRIGNDVRIPRDEVQRVLDIAWPPPRRPRSDLQGVGLFISLCFDNFPPKQPHATPAVEAFALQQKGGVKFSESSRFRFVAIRQKTPRSSRAPHTLPVQGRWESEI